MTKKPSAKYWQAIIWIARNDDTDFMEDANPIPSVTLTMVADLWGVPMDDALQHLRKALEQME